MITGRSKMRRKPQYFKNYFKKVIILDFFGFCMSFCMILCIDKYELLNIFYES